MGGEGFIVRDILLGSKSIGIWYLGTGLMPRHEASPDASSGKHDLLSF